MVAAAPTPESGPVRVPTDLFPWLRCPACHGALVLLESQFACTIESCRARYPVVNGVPVLIDDQRSLLRAADACAELRATTGRDRGLAAWARALTPSIDRHVKTAANLERLVSLLRAQGGSPRLLLLAHSGRGKTASEPGWATGMDIVHADAAAGPRVMLICDPEELPFDDGAFDAVIALDVLQRVPDAWRCAQEIHRVLQTGGLVYSETPFLQPVHLGAHDYQRLTHLGQRRLFRRFEEIDSGASAGPGMAVAWTWRFLLWGFGRGRVTSFVLRTIADFTSFFLTALDRRLIDRRRALDAAAAVYFLGRRSETTRSDRELAAGYRGAQLRLVASGGAPRTVNEVFSEWAATGQDEEMARNHAAAVEEMLGNTLAARGAAGPFTAVDAGCGNGWVVRRLRARDDCRAVTGVDCSASMIAKARALDPEGDYVLADLLDWTPPEPVDLVHGMEVLYYLADPVALLRRIRTAWLRPGGWAVFGIDHYEENPASHAWPTRLGVGMTTWSAERWEGALEEAGFTAIRRWHAAAAGDLPGTLALLARAPEGPGAARTAGS